MATSEITGSKALALPDERRTAPGPREPVTIWRRIRKVLLALVTTGVVIALLYPFVWLLAASLKPRKDVFERGLIPHPFQFSNYSTVWHELPMLSWITNSVVVGIAAALAVTVSSSLVAFGFSYFQFPGRNALFGLVLATMMLPGAVTLIPTYLIWNSIGLANTQVPLWAGNLFGSAFYIFLLRQFFRGLPREVFDAARVDGCGFFALFWRIVVPMSRPALAITFLFEFQASWVDLLRPLVYLREPELFTLPRGLKAVLDQFGQGGERKWELVLAANVIATLPMLILFALFGRYVMQGITIGGGDKE